MAAPGPSSESSVFHEYQISVTDGTPYHDAVRKILTVFGMRSVTVSRDYYVRMSGTNSYRVTNLYHSVPPQGAPYFRHVEIKQHVENTVVSAFRLVHSTKQTVAELPADWTAKITKTVTRTTFVSSAYPFVIVLKRENRTTGSWRTVIEFDLVDNTTSSTESALLFIAAYYGGIGYANSATYGKYKTLAFTNARILPIRLLDPRNDPFYAVGPKMNGTSVVVIFDVSYENIVIDDGEGTTARTQIIRVYTTIPGRHFLILIAVIQYAGKRRVHDAMFMGERMLPLHLDAPQLFNEDITPIYYLYDTLYIENMTIDTFDLAERRRHMYRYLQLHAESRSEEGNGIDMYKIGTLDIFTCQFHKIKGDGVDSLYEAYERLKIGYTAMGARLSTDGLIITPILASWETLHTSTANAAGVTPRYIMKYKDAKDTTVDLLVGTGNKLYEVGKSSREESALLEYTPPFWVEIPPIGAALIGAVIEFEYAPPFIGTRQYLLTPMRSRPDKHGTPNYITTVITNQSQVYANPSIPDTLGLTLNRVAMIQRYLASSLIRKASHITGYIEFGAGNGGNLGAYPKDAYVLFIEPDTTRYAELGSRAAHGIRRGSHWLTIQGGVDIDDPSVFTEALDRGGFQLRSEDWHEKFYGANARVLVNLYHVLTFFNPAQYAKLFKQLLVAFPRIKHVTILDFDQSGMTEDTWVWPGIASVRKRGAEAEWNYEENRIVVKQRGWIPDLSQFPKAASGITLIDVQTYMSKHQLSPRIPQYSLLQQQEKEFLAMLRIGQYAL